MAQPELISSQLQRDLQKGLGCCNSVLPQIEYFESLAQVCPELDPLVTEIRIKYEHLKKLCHAGLTLAQQQQQ